MPSKCNGILVTYCVTCILRGRKHTQPRITYIILHLKRRKHLCPYSYLQLFCRRDMTQNLGFQQPENQVWDKEGYSIACGSRGNYQGIIAGAPCGGTQADDVGWCPKYWSQLGHQFEVRWATHIAAIVHCSILVSFGSVSWVVKEWLLCVVKIELCCARNNIPRYYSSLTIVTWSDLVMNERPHGIDLQQLSSSSGPHIWVTWGWASFVGHQREMHEARSTWSTPFLCYVESQTGRKVVTKRCFHLENNVYKQKAGKQCEQHV